MSPQDLATLSLLDPEQSVCPDAHRCSPGAEIGRRRCSVCAYDGQALICWNITPDAVDAAERAGAEPRVVTWARAFVDDHR